MTQQGDPHLRLFASVLGRAIDKYGDLSEEDVTTRQRRQVEQLVAYETEFRQRLIKHQHGRAVYAAFIAMIRAERRNILDARPFFRERQSVFMDRISPAFKENKPEGLFPFAINYLFVSFVMKCRKWHTTGRQARFDQGIIRAARNIQNSRTELVELNMPLALSRVKIFWYRTRGKGKLDTRENLPGGTHMEYMDFVQVAAEGLMAGVDKFVLPYTPVFRAVCIGRMVGDFIEANSKTLLHFFPQDKRKIYRARKLLGRGTPVDTSMAVDEINRGVEKRHWTNTSEVAELMTATVTQSADTEVQDPAGEVDGGVTQIDTFAAPEEGRPDFQAEDLESRQKVADAILALSIKEQKFLRMRGVSELMMEQT